MSHTFDMIIWNNPHKFSFPSEYTDKKTVCDEDEQDVIRNKIIYPDAEKDSKTETSSKVDMSFLDQRRELFSFPFSFFLIWSTHCWQVRLLCLKQLVYALITLNYSSYLFHQEILRCSGTQRHYSPNTCQSQRRFFQRND